MCLVLFSIAAGLERRLANCSSVQAVSNHVPDGCCVYIDLVRTLAGVNNNNPERDSHIHSIFDKNV